MTRLTESDWLAEMERLTAASREPDPGLTVPEWADRMGVSDKTAIKRLAAAKSLGMLVRGKRPGESLNGKRISLTVYSIQKPAGAVQKARRPQGHP